MLGPLTKRQRFWISLILVLLLFRGGYGFLNYSKVSLPYLYTHLAFSWYLYKDSKELEDQSRSGLSSVYYFTSYYLNGLLSAVEGTGSERLLRRTIHYIDNMLATVQNFEVEGTRYQAWRPFLVTADSAIAKPNLHFSFQSCIPIARAAALIRTDPRWRVRYAKAADRYVAIVDEMVFRYWLEYEFKDEIPWVNPEHFPIWNDNGCNLGLNATYLYRATGDPRYRDVALRIGRHFQSKVVPVGKGLVWESQTIRLGSDTDNTPGSVGNQAGVPDTSHTNREAFLMVSQYEGGLLFSKEDLDRMAATFMEVLWNQDRENPMFSNYLNGSDKPYRVYHSEGLNGAIYHGWAMIGGYSSEVRRVLLETLKAIVKGRQNPSIERNMTSYGARVGLTGHLLRDFALTWASAPQTRWQAWWRSGTRVFFPRATGVSTGEVFFSSSTVANSATR
jgi:hypothetical protein